VALSTSSQINLDERSVPGSEAGQRSVFATTHWSVVLTAGTGDAPEARNALEKLCQAYWYPLYGYVRRRGYSPDDAKDLTQSFFAWLLERNWLGRADQQRGRFRSFLLTSFSRFLANEWDRFKAQKRGGGQIVALEFDAAEMLCQGELANNMTPEQSFERRWAIILLDQVMNRLSAEFAQDGKSELFAILKPCLLGERTSQPYAALADKVGMTEGSVKVAVHRLRQRYRQILRDAIADTVEKPEEIEGELRHLFSVLARR
jgi:RNA polymerase sigma-70 factor (ECF subfamily)